MELTIVLKLQLILQFFILPKRFIIENILYQPYLTMDELAQYSN